jgi:hypothetical protein
MRSEEACSSQRAFAPQEQKIGFVPERIAELMAQDEPIVMRKQVVPSQMASHFSKRRSSQASQTSTTELETFSVA